MKNLKWKILAIALLLPMAIAMAKHGKTTHAMADTRESSPEEVLIINNYPVNPNAAQTRNRRLATQSDNNNTDTARSGYRFRLDIFGHRSSKDSDQNTDNSVDNPFVSDFMKFFAQIFQNSGAINNNNNTPNNIPNIPNSPNNSINNNGVNNGTTRPTTPEVPPSQSQNNTARRPDNQGPQELHDIRGRDNNSTRPSDTKPIRVLPLIEIGANTIPDGMPVRF